jgi:hypothetical protein
MNKATIGMSSAALNVRSRWLSMHTKGIVSLVATVLLCLPSLLGGAALVMNLLVNENIMQWGQTSSALVALGVFLGSPLVVLAALVGGSTALRRSVPAEFKYAQLAVVGVAAIAALSLLFRFDN